MNDLPDVEELLDGAAVVRLPMRIRFRGQQAREAMLLRGPAGWAEFAPFAEYGPEESSAWLAAAVDAGWCGLGEPLRTHIPINATVPAVPASQVSEVLAGFGRPEAIPAVKVKVAEPGQTLDDDVARLREVSRLLPQAGLRADANGAWDLQQAVRGIDALAEVAHGRMEYVEQPVAGVEPLAELREMLDSRGISVRIAADEALRKAEDPLRVARLGAADLIVVKAAPLGGVTRAAEVVRAAGLDAVVSSALDTSVGLTAGLALAARLDRLPYACGLGTAALLAADVVASPLIPQEGRLEVPVRDGRVTAPEPQAELMAAHRVEQQRHRWWEERLHAAHQVLVSRRP